TKPIDTKLANLHFWLGTLGILFYIISMWVSGITQGLMWRAVDETGRLVYPDFIETVVRIVPLYYVRALGGTMFLAGVLVMFYNVWKTIKTGEKDAQPESARVPKRVVFAEEKEAFHRRIEGLPMIFT